MNLHHDAQPIIALCTPSGAGAIALLRLSGQGAFEVAQKMGTLASDQRITELPTHTIHLGSILDENLIAIDQVLFLLMRAPKTYTGQDTVEITCHNNPFIVERIIEQAIVCGARLAQSGEFTRRAVLNNKIDLVQAEAVNELIHAQTQAALKHSLAQLHGSLSHEFHALEEDLLKALAFCQASFEFIDEEMEFGSQIKEFINNILRRIANLKQNFNQQDHLRSGIRIAFLGTVNAGKSSLFNALLGISRAIVSPHAGTTRDSIEAGISRGGNYWTLVDTAGLRQTNDSIEQEGIKRSQQEAQKADIIVLVCDAANSLSTEQEKEYRALYAQWPEKIIFVYNKADLVEKINHYPDLPTPLLVSAHTKNGLEILKSALEKKVAQLFDAIESPFLLTKRQHSLIVALEQQLLALNKTLEFSPHYELLSIHLTDALACLSELTGKTVNEASMDAVFRQFCVGK